MEMEKDMESMPSCKLLLPFFPASGFPMEFQVGAVTLLGIAFFFVASLGAFRLLAGLDVNQPARVRSWFLIGLCAPIGLGLYSLAALGDWRAVFGLCAF